LPFLLIYWFKRSFHPSSFRRLEYSISQIPHCPDQPGPEQRTFFGERKGKGFPNSKQAFFNTGLAFGVWGLALIKPDALKAFCEPIGMLHLMNAKLQTPNTKHMYS